MVLNFFLMVGKVVRSYECTELWNEYLDTELVSLKLWHVTDKVQDINLLHRKAETTYLNYNFMVFAGKLAVIQQTVLIQGFLLVAIKKQRIHLFPHVSHTGLWLSTAE